MDYDSDEFDETVISRDSQVNNLLNTHTLIIIFIWKKYMYYLKVFFLFNQHCLLFEQDSVVQRSSRKWSDNLPAFLFDSSIDAKKRSKLIEKEMNEQAKIINDLQILGASYGTIEQEMKRLHELEALVFKDFRR